tara:strand:+ start:619 stop:1395 length:777 start_codon:yes stop_codon:yes gene_type:complete
MAELQKRAPLRVDYDEKIQEYMDQFNAIDTSALTVSAQKIHLPKNILAEKEFQNAYKDIKNPYADLEDNFKNPYEDLTVNQQQFQLQKQQSMQSQANIMRGLQGAAGGSGIAGLAQAMANQGAIQAQQAAADIGRQERENRLMEAQGEMSIEQMRSARQELKARGAFDASMAQAQGQQVADQLANQRELAVGQMQLSAASANAANALQAASINQQGRTDARNLEFQVSQANMSYWAGQKQADRENEIADKSWWESTFG